MTADQLRECREAFEKAHEEIYGAHPPGTLPNGRWRLWQIAWNTRPTAVASHAEGEVVAWRVVADEAIWDLLNDDERDVLYFDKNDVPTGEEAEGFTITPLYTHPPRSGDEARDAARYRWLRKLDDRACSGVLSESSGMAYLEDDELDQAIDAAMAEQHGETDHD